MDNRRAIIPLFYRKIALFLLHFFFGVQRGGGAPPAPPETPKAKMSYPPHFRRKVFIFMQAAVRLPQSRGDATTRPAHFIIGGKIMSPWDGLCGGRDSVRNATLRNVMVLAFYFVSVLGQYIWVEVCHFALLESLLINRFIFGVCCYVFSFLLQPRRNSQNSTHGKNHTNMP